jgi:hypothetical protein
LRASFVSRLITHAVIVERIIYGRRKNLSSRAKRLIST